MIDDYFYTLAPDNDWDGGVLDPEPKENPGVYGPLSKPVIPEEMPRVVEVAR